MREDVLRDSTPKKSPRVPKEATNRVREFEEATPDNLQDILLKYLKEDLANGGAYASSVMARAAIEAQDELDVLPHFPWLIGAMANGGQIDYDVRNWTKATHHIEIEELKVTR